MPSILVSTGREPTFKLITPRHYLWVRDLQVASSVSDANQQALREGMWVNELTTATAGGPTEARLATGSTGLLDSGGIPGAGGIPRCLFADGDRNDINFAGKLPVLMGSGWVAQVSTDLVTITSIAAGDFLGVSQEATIAAGAGKMIRGASSKWAVARCLWIGTDWMEYEAIPSIELA